VVLACYEIAVVLLARTAPAGVRPAPHA